MKKHISSKVRNALSMVAIILVATVVCVVLRQLNSSELPIHLMFVLAVLIISRFTDGYVYGIVTSVTAVFIINFAFTYPFLAFNFTITGYPITFITLFVVSVVTSTLTTQIKHQQAIRTEAEREKLQADLLRAISHDLRTPLTSIVGSSSAMLDDAACFSEEQKLALLSEIRDDATWLIQMVENILSATRVRGETKIKKNPEPLEELTGEIANKFRKRYPKMPVYISIPNDLVFIPMDAMLIEQVIMNLMENAVLHGIGATKIDFSVSIVEKEAVFSVKNGGDFVDTAKLQIHMDTSLLSPRETRISESRQNLGIGLSVCSAIVKAHGGNMRIYGNTGGGVCAEFSLPLMEDSDIVA